MRKTVKPITAKYLQNAATFYLERYPSTAEGLRRMAWDSAGNGAFWQPVHLKAK